MNNEILIGVIDPAALPALRIAGGMFLIINLLAGAYIIRHWQRFFGRASEQDVEAVRHLRVEVVVIPWIAMTTVLIVEWLQLWTN